MNDNQNNLPACSAEMPRTAETEGDVKNSESSTHPLAEGGDKETKTYLKGDDGADLKEEIDPIEEKTQGGTSGLFEGRPPSSRKSSQMAARFAMGAVFVERRMEGWLEEERAVREKYPEFSLDTAMKDAVFKKMLRAGIPIEKAYTALNFDSILSRELDRTALKYSGNIKARALRPVENGTLSSGGVTVRSGVETLSRGQRADIAKRAMKGEKISF